MEDSSLKKIESELVLNHLAKAQSFLKLKDYKNAFKFASISLKESSPVESTTILSFITDLLQLMRDEKNESLDSLIDVIYLAQFDMEQKENAVDDIRSLIRHSPNLIKSTHVLRLVHLTKNCNYTAIVLIDILKLKFHSRMIIDNLDTNELFKTWTYQGHYNICIDLLHLLFEIDSQSNAKSLTPFQFKVYQLLFKNLSAFMDLTNDQQSKLLQGISFLLKYTDVVHLFGQDESFIHAFLACTESLSHRGLVSAILAKLYKENSKDTLLPMEILENFILKRLESLDERQNLIAVTALHSLSIASPSTGRLLFIEDVMYLFLLNGTLQLQTVVLEFFFDIATDQTSKVKLSARYGEIIKLYSESHFDINLRLLAKTLNIKFDSLKAKECTRDSAKQIEDLISLLSFDSKKNSSSTIIETLVYLTSIGLKKENLISLENLKPLIQFSLTSSVENRYGLAAIFLNLTQFRKALSDKEQNLEKLHRMSTNESEKIDDPLDDDLNSTRRCQIALKNGIIIALNLFGKSPTSAMKKILASIFLNLTRDASSRGIIIQQGGVKTMMFLSECTGDIDVRMNAAQSLARLGITNDPVIAYKGQRIIEMVGPFSGLLESEETLKQFEGLMALTNLAGVGGEVMAKIFKTRCMQKVEDLILSDNLMVRRAATECITNMLYDESVYQWYIEKCTKSSSFVDLLLAFCDLDDIKTRYAASAALSILTSNSAVARTICESKRFKNLLILIEDDDSGLISRGMESIKNIFIAGLGNYVDQEGGFVSLTVLTEHENSNISKVAVDLMKYIK